MANSGKNQTVQDKLKEFKQQMNLNVPNEEMYSFALTLIEKLDLTRNSKMSLSILSNMLTAVYQNVKHPFTRIMTTPTDYPDRVNIEIQLCDNCMQNVMSMKAHWLDENAVTVLKKEQNVANHITIKTTNFRLFEQGNNHFTLTYENQTYDKFDTSVERFISGREGAIISEQNVSYIKLDPSSISTIFTQSMKTNSDLNRKPMIDYSRYLFDGIFCYDNRNSEQPRQLENRQIDPNRTDTVEAVLGVQKRLRQYPTITIFPWNEN